MIAATNKTRELRSQAVLQEPDRWTLIPTSSIYTCQQVVYECVETNGFDNTFAPFTCKQEDAQECTNKFHEHVIFQQPNVMIQCHNPPATTTLTIPKDGQELSLFGLE